MPDAKTTTTAPSGPRKGQGQALEDQRLAPGDKLPNMALPDQGGTVRTFYNELKGGPIVLFVAASFQQRAPEAVLAGLVERLPTLATHRAELIALSGDSVAQNAALADGLSADLQILAGGESGVIEHLLAGEPPLLPGVEPPRPECCTYVLDPNQRVLAVIGREPCADHAAAALAALESWQGAKVEPALVTRGAPALILTEIFEPAFCAELIEAWRSGQQREGGVSTGLGNVYEPGSKKTLEHQVSDPALSRRITVKLARRVGPELRKCFNHYQPFRLEGPIVMRYEASRQDFFGLHRDDLRQSDRRRFALSLNLNEGYEGGELIFPEYGPHLYRPPAGAAAIFSCALLHEARPVTRGERFVMTSFFCDVDQPDPRVPAERRRHMAV